MLLWCVPCLLSSFELHCGSSSESISEWYLRIGSATKQQTKPWRSQTLLIHSLKPCRYCPTSRLCSACFSGTYRRRPRQPSGAALSSGVLGSQCQLCCWPWLIQTKIMGRFPRWKKQYVNFLCLAQVLVCCYDAWNAPARETQKLRSARFSFNTLSKEDIVCFRHMESISKK